MTATFNANGCPKPIEFQKRRGGTLDFDERMSLRPVLWTVLHETTGNAFESLFHDIMALSDPTFVDVRTHGKIGDKGSDGLSLVGGKLYACYAPETPNAAATVAKLKNDVASALRQRPNEFSTFVFVHNDARGVHPELASELAALAVTHAPLRFELIGIRQLEGILGRCHIDDVEHVLGRRLPLHHAGSLGLEEMTDLLELLASSKATLDAAPPPHPVSANKLAYSDLSPETQTELLEAMKFSEMIDQYYARRIDVTERDRVATSFHQEYLALANATREPEDVLLGLRTFLSGSRSVAGPKYRAQTAVLSFFFQSCDIFEDAPAGWTPPSTVHA